MLGLVIGWIAFRAMCSIDDYKVEVLISLAVVMGGYAIARPFHASGPVAMAVAGLIIGVVESLSAYLVGPVYKDVIVYILFVLVLWFRPQGLMGKA